jgi:ParB family chromosome partitioning protein
MIPPPDIQFLAASALDLADRTYFLSPEEVQPSPQLIDSIRDYGILHPPLVQQHDRNRFIVIAGWKRLEAAITILHRDTVPCIVIPSDRPSLYLYSLLLEQSLLGTPLSLAEQSAFFADLCTTCAVEEALPLLAKLGYKPNRHQLDELLAMHNLSRSALLALHRGVINYASARKLLRVSRDDQETLLAMINRFQLSGSKQQKLIELSTELLHREQRSVEDIIDSFLKKIERPGQENLPQQAAALLNWLSEQCFPRSVRAEKEFSRCVAQLDLPSTMQVEHSPSFEENSVTLALRLADWDALRKALPGIRQLLAAK